MSFFASRMTATICSRTSADICGHVSICSWGILRVFVSSCTYFLCVSGCSSTSSSWASSSCGRCFCAAGLVGLSGLFDLLGLPVWLVLAALLVLLALLVLPALVTAGFATRELVACDVRLPGGLPLRFCVPSLSARLCAYSESVNMFWLRGCVGTYHDVATRVAERVEFVLTLALGWARPNRARRTDNIQRLASTTNNNYSILLLVIRFISWGGIYLLV
jgi:hypothetical protein